MKKKLATLGAAFKLAFDSLVRTYSPLAVSAVAGFLAQYIQVPDELQAFIVGLVAFVAGALWYGLSRLYEVITGKVSKLLTLGIVQTKPVVYSPLSKTELYADEAAAAARKTAAHAKPLD